MLKRLQQKHWKLLWFLFDKINKWISCICGVTANVGVDAKKTFATCRGFTNFIAYFTVLMQFISQPNEISLTFLTWINIYGSMRVRILNQQRWRWWWRQRRTLTHFRDALSKLGKIDTNISHNFTLSTFQCLMKMARIHFRASEDCRDDFSLVVFDVKLNTIDRHVLLLYASRCFSLSLWC